MKIAVYPGTFDPITNGHIDIIKRSLRIFDRVVIAVAPNPKKTPLFDLNERIFMIEEATNGMMHIEIEPFDGLLVDYIRQKGAIAIIRGLRAVSDFEYELQMALMNRKLSDTIETVFMMPSEEYSYLTSSLIKEVASYGGEVKDLVPSIAAKRLKDIFKRRD
ncbi:MAG TPA: pantetheine-phosphate adenylyltransferase [Nitrospiria bacterium]|nr:pantetheine-phosphate adenylyltransferase [Nitrospiria bacterium]